MPNTKHLVANFNVYNQLKIQAKSKSVCDYMIFMGADGENYKDSENMNPRVCAIKFYLSKTW